MRLGTLFLIAILIAVGYFVTAPWWTFRSMRDAARNNDQPALARVIDYDSVRQGLADQLAGRPPPPPPPSVWSDPMGALRVGRTMRSSFQLKMPFRSNTNSVLRALASGSLTLMRQRSVTSPFR